jgi:hypothetical protein
MHGQRNHIFKCDPMKREAKKLQFRECESHGWLWCSFKDEEDGPWDSTSMHGDLDSMNQIAERNHAQRLRDFRRRM